MAADQAFLETILREVAIAPQHISIERVEDSHGVLLRIKAGKPDMPRIIGKEGRNIAAIRLVMKLFAKDGPNISLILDEPTQT